MLAKPLMFLSAYAPLFALLAIRFQPRPLMLTCAGLAIAGLASLLLLLNLDSRSEKGAHKLIEVKDAGAEVGAYLGAYLLPFVTVTSPNFRDEVAYLLFLVVAAAVYVRSSVVQINPLLYLLGYQVLAVVDKNHLRAYLVTRRKYRVGDIVQATRFSDDVLIARRDH
jgi:hypothetical protein